MATIIVKCAVCGKVIALKRRVLVGGISHGYCRRCEQVERIRLRRELEEWKRGIPNA